jgi:hypothetical protein
MPSRIDGPQGPSSADKNFKETLRDLEYLQLGMDQNSHTIDAAATIQRNRIQAILI